MKLMAMIIPIWLEFQVANLEWNEHWNNPQMLKAYSRDALLFNFLFLP